jgi:hypothetical protein
MILSSMSTLLKLAVVCFVIGFLCGFWAAGEVLHQINSRPVPSAVHNSCSLVSLSV